MFAEPEMWSTLIEFRWDSAHAPRRSVSAMRDRDLGSSQLVDVGLGGGIDHEDQNVLPHYLILKVDKGQTNGPQFEQVDIEEALPWDH